jgi:hypothetical protein
MPDEGHGRGHVPSEIQNAQENRRRAACPFVRFDPAVCGADGVLSKPIIFDVESATVSARLEYAEDLQDFILQKLQPPMATRLAPRHHTTDASIDPATYHRSSELVAPTAV